MRLTEEQRLIRETVREFVEAEIAPDVAEMDREPLSKADAITYMKRMGEIGVGPMAPPEERFETDDPRTDSIVAEEVSRVWPSLQVTMGMSATAGFARIASGRTREAYADELAANELVGCLAITEPTGGSDTRVPNTTARREGDEYVLSGEKAWVSNAPIADVALVVAWDEDAEARDFFLVDRRTGGFETRSLDKLGWKASPTGQLFLDDCRVPLGNKLSRAYARAAGGGDGNDGNDADGEEDGGGEAPASGGLFGAGPGEDPLNAIFASMRNGMASIAVGIMQAAFDAALDYATDRETFGAPIAGRQLIQEKLFSIKANLETSRQLTYHVDDLIAAGHPDARMMSSLSKGYVCEKCVEAASDALQIHGANGLSTDYPVERYYRDARTMTIPDGTTEIQKLIVGYELTDIAAYT